MTTEVQQLIHAAAFAAEKHGLQMRKNNTGAYIRHPLNVADILSNEAGLTDIDTLIAAILHGKSTQVLFISSVDVAWS